MAVAGIGALAVGAFFTVFSTENIVKALGIPGTIGGLFITAPVAALPEAFATRSVARSGQITSATTGVIGDHTVTMTLAFIPLTIVTTPIQDLRLFWLSLASTASDVGRCSPSLPPTLPSLRWWRSGRSRSDQARPPKADRSRNMSRAARLRRACGFAVLVSFPKRTALAHADQPPTPHDFWTAWTLDPLVIGPLIVVAVLYSSGLHKGWQRAGFGRGVTGWQAAAFAGGMLALALALVWPLDAMGESLFAAHMAQHIVLMGVAAPLLVLGAPLPTMLRVLPRPWQRWSALLAQQNAWRRSWRWLTAALVAMFLQQVALWTWHTPPAIAAALRSDVVHALMHVSLFATALLFWFAIVRPRGGGYGRSILALLVTAKLSAILGALLTFAPIVLYPAYGRLGEPWGFSPLEDQQLAGLLMMTPGAMMYVMAGVVFVAVWLASLERMRPPTIGQHDSDARRPAAE